ncbi:hypothetical protein [Amycolatopsis eburnea]|uniref:Uncharacterized protein n=1 Tax=Amycolatopsis eburnea TaxID=2267691 RepID=A0A427T153_9PSEU|nr:hypothetical protein [Amycolatopsis eburnea]RSD11512.1 hypothetical protein EIY87_32495 [Amycolatopsis eburnea]
MSVHAALARPVSPTARGRHAKPRPAWHRVAAGAVFAALALIIAGMVWPPAALAVLVPLGAGVAKLRTASRTVDAIFAEELIARERVSENGDRVEIS